MRTLGTQVKLRRLIRTYADSWRRIALDPLQLARVGSVVDRLLELAGELRDTWERESLAGGPETAPETTLEPALEHYVADSLRSIELALAGMQQAGADLNLLRDDFEAAALPLEVFLRGLDAEPALQRSA